MEISSIKFLPSSSSVYFHRVQLTHVAFNFVEFPSFCNAETSPRKTDEYTATGGVLDVTLRYSTPSKRPEFECLVKCVPYQGFLHLD